MWHLKSGTDWILSPLVITMAACQSMDQSMYGGTKRQSQKMFQHLHRIHFPVLNIKNICALCRKHINDETCVGGSLATHMFAVQDLFCFPSTCLPSAVDEWRVQAQYRGVSAYNSLAVVVTYNSFAQPLHSHSSVLSPLSLAKTSKTTAIWPDHLLQQHSTFQIL